MPMTKRTLPIAFAFSVIATGALAQDAELTVRYSGPASQDVRIIEVRLDETAVGVVGAGCELTFSASPGEHVVNFRTVRKDVDVPLSLAPRSTVTLLVTADLSVTQE